MKKLEDYAIVMAPSLDQVAIAKVEIAQGENLEYMGQAITILEKINRGHRFTVRDVPDGEFVRQNGYTFGQSAGIEKGRKISQANIRCLLPKPDNGGFETPAPAVLKDKYLNTAFQGYRRSNGAAGTRNYYLVVPTSMCVSETALQVALKMDAQADMANRYPNIDGIVAIPNTEGCGCASTGGQIDRFLTVLKGFVNHPNVGGCLIMDLGCEQTNYERVHEYLSDNSDGSGKPIDWITVQQSGGTRLAQEKAERIILSKLEMVNDVKREAIPLGKLIVGTECGGSDSFSGITANPVIGNMADKVIFGGGAAIMSEVPEMLGTYSMLLPRFRSLEVARKFQLAIDWYLGMADKLGLNISDNLVPKNIEGGIINSYIKSLGAVLKGGTTVIEDVIGYGEPVGERGLYVMQGPGGDLESLTGLVSSGANIICFSTGYGAISGNAICPVIKISSNDETYGKMPEDMDFNAGRVISENIGLEDMGDELLAFVVAVASGRKTNTEKLKQRQFQVWTAGKLSL